MSIPPTPNAALGAEQARLPSLSSTLSLPNGPALRLRNGTPFDSAQGLNLSNGWSKWFMSEVHAHDSQLKSFLRGSFPSVRDVDDVVQESYLRIWKAKAGRPIQFAKAFLFQVAKNIALDFLRRERNSPVQCVTDLADLCVIDGKPGVADQISAREEAALLAEALHALPARCREIVILRKLKRVPQKEIAQQLGISEQTVQNQVFRGVRRCEQFLAEHGVRH